MPESNPSHTAFLSDLASTAKQALDLLADAQVPAGEYVALGHAPNGADPITPDDFAGNLAGSDPAEALTVVKFVGTITAASKVTDTDTGLTPEQALYALARRSR